MFSEPRVDDSGSRVELHVPRQWGPEADELARRRFKESLLVIELPPGEGSRDVDGVTEESADNGDRVFRMRVSSSSSAAFLRRVNCLLN